jgi:hypothetical protein
MSLTLPQPKTLRFLGGYGDYIVLTQHCKSLQVIAENSEQSASFRWGARQLRALPSERSILPEPRRLHKK